LDASVLAFGDCRAVREAVKRHSALDDSDIVTFPWGIDLGRFHPGTSTSTSIRAELGWENAEVFLSTRTWERVYAIDVLIEAFAAVCRQRPDSRLMLLGDGSLHDEVMGLIDKLELQRVVHAPGRMGSETIPDYFRMADVYVSSALSDGTSVSLLEAMASGLPVVVSDSYGNLEWVTPGVNGELAAPGDAAALARAMLDVVSIPGVRTAMGLRNIEVARERANWDRNFPELAAAVERVARR
ncbi:MAG: glycosyltransferase, partial [Gemmatimonadaceae bacterium]